MRAILSAVILCAMLAAAAAPAGAGPVKHWGELPGREIRTIALRGDLSYESYATVVPGADGWIYVRGKSGVYRLLGTDGSADTVATFAWCDDRQARAVVPYSTPAFACVAKNIIVEMKGKAQYRRVLPTPRWTDRTDVYAYDYPFVTAIDRADGGRWWFSYGYAGGLGYADADGAVGLAHLRGLPPVRDIARFGNDIYLAADGCVVARVRGLRLAGSTRLCTNRVAPRLVRTGDALWVVGTGDTTVERRGARGAVRRWSLGLPVDQVAYDRRSRTTYFLGADMSDHNVLIALAADGVPRATRLPMIGGSSLAVDGRGRIWITSPREHSLVVIAPRGEWG